jgi:D-sedoheptulose 7-phosphate isomerase
VVLGNGGSAAAASHWVCDFGKGINTEKSKRLKIMAPVDNSAVFSALGNDCGYNTTFSEQIRNFLEPGDLVISLSVSGNSENLVESHRYAKEVGATTVCIVGDLNGRLIEMSDFAMVIKSKNYGVVEDLHIILEHAISQQMRKNNEMYS